MRKIVYTWALALLLMPLHAQQPEVKQDTVKVMNKVEVIETPENTRVTLGENEVLIVEENGDTVKVRLGSKGISIIEGEDGTEIKVIEMDEKQKTSTKNKKLCL